MISPVQGGNISNPSERRPGGLYGCRRQLRTDIEYPSEPRCAEGQRWHAGIDIGKPEGTPVYAVGNGVVEYASDINGSTELWPEDSRYAGRPRQGYGGYGKVILLKIGTWYILYAHLASVSVRTGQQVSDGEVIGSVGRTGGSVSNPGRLFAGPHLHLEISTRRRIDRRGTGTVDPLEWLAHGGVDIRQTPTGYRIFHGVADLTRWESTPEREPVAEAPVATAVEELGPMETYRLVLGIMERQSNLLRTGVAALPVSEAWKEKFRLLTGLHNNAVAQFWGYFRAGDVRALPAAARRVVGTYGEMVNFVRSGPTAATIELGGRAVDAARLLATLPAETRRKMRNAMLVVLGLGALAGIGYAAVQQRKS